MRVVDAWATVPFIATVAVITGFAGQDAIYQVLSGGPRPRCLLYGNRLHHHAHDAEGQDHLRHRLRCHHRARAPVRRRPEGVAFSILFMNMFTPLIDRYTRPQPAGGVKHALV